MAVKANPNGELLPKPLEEISGGEPGSKLGRLESSTKPFQISGLRFVELTICDRLSIRDALLNAYERPENALRARVFVLKLECKTLEIVKP